MDDTKYKLSDLDKMGFTKSVKLAIFYELQPSVDKEKLISSMTEGVKSVTLHLPFMAGNLQFDATGKLCIMVAPGSEIELNIRQYDSTESKSLSALAKDSFSPNDLDLTPFLPKDPAAGTNPACALQFSFIEGGLVLGFRINHAAGDWTSIDKFLSLVCHSVKAYQEGREPPSYNPDLHRAPYNTPPPEPTISRESRLEHIVAFHIIEKSQFKLPPPPTPTKVSVFKATEASLAKVKALCTPHLTDVDYITSYDCISVLLWTATTRTRLQLHPEKATSPSRFIHPIDIRTRDPDHKTSPEYFGNAVIASAAGPLTGQTLVAEGAPSLANAATLIRKSVNAVDLSTIGHATSVLASLTPTEAVAPSVDFADMDVFMNSWYSGTAEKYDIAAGATPVAVRQALSMPGACAVVLPNFSRGEARVFEILVQSPVEEQEVLRKDAELLKYFELVA